MPRKTVIVGMGGTGDWVLTFLKSRLYAAYGEKETQKDVQFLLLDTIHEATREGAFGTESKKFQVQTGIDQHEEMVAHLGGVRVEPHEYLALTGEIHDVAESIRQGKDAHTRHLDWFTADFYLRALPAAAMNITDGAGQWRQFGRIALVLSTQRGQFTKRIERIIRDSGVPSGDTLMFYLVSSLAGGTGAGIFLDTAHIIRNVAAKNGVKTWVVGFLVLPSAFQRVLGDSTMEATITRSFAAYRELVRFQTQAGQGVPVRIRYSPGYDVFVTAKPFDTVFLFDAETEWKSLADLPPWAGISPSIADSLEVFIDRTAGSAVLQDLINASARMAKQVRLDETLPAQFHSMGSYKIVLPARQYAAIFSSRFAIDFLTGVFSTTGEGGAIRLRRTERREDEYRESAIQFARKIPSLFTQIVDLLPDQPGSDKKLRAFAARHLEEYRSFLRPREAPEGADLQVLTHNPIEGVQTGREVGDDAETAARRIVRECQRLMKTHWETLGDVLERIVAQLEREISGEVHHQTLQLLNRQVDGYADHPVGTALAFLDQIALICDDLATKVLGPTEGAIDRQASGQNSLGHWETQIALAQSAMEATKGFDSFLKRGRAYEAQRAYLQLQGRYLERRRLAETFRSYRAIVSALKKQAAELAARLREWADTAVLSDQFSARREARGDIAEIESALIQAGECFTSSYGLSAYRPGSPVDVTMGGYRETLYDEVAKPLLEQWLKGPEWELIGGKGLRLNVATSHGQSEAFEAKSGKELHQQVFDAVWRELEPRITGLSIFDYFLHRGLTAVQVATFLKENSGPLLGRLTPTESMPSRSVQLLAQEPKDERAVHFLSDLKIQLKGLIDVGFQEGMKQDFDNPYTLTLLYLVQDVREKQITVMNDYERSYNEQIIESDNYVVNHVFRSEQEAARIEKRHRYAAGQRGSEGWTRLHPRIARLLDRPERLRRYLELWAHDIIRLAPDPEQKMRKVWMVLPRDASPDDNRVVWLTAPNVRDRSERSPLLAMEQFCFVENSARPGREIKIDYAALDGALRDVRNPMIDLDAERPYAEIITVYEHFLAGPLPKLIHEGCDEVHSEKEAADLIIACGQYLTEELDRLRKS